MIMFRRLINFMVKLKTQVLSLQEQLSQRPPLEEVQEMKKEYRSLDMLMLGSQRENQRCMADLERCVLDYIKTALLLLNDFIVERKTE